MRAGTALSLTELGNVPQAHEHEWRGVEARDPIILPRTIVKWYHVHREGVPVPPALDAEAQAVLIDGATGGAWTPEYGLHFAMLHASTAHASLMGQLRPSQATPAPCRVTELRPSPNGQLTWRSWNTATGP
jgi:hypothetical protein